MLGCIVKLSELSVNMVICRICSLTSGNYFYIFNHMVKYEVQLNNLFQSLSDPIRRDIVERVSRHELTVGELVEAYDVSFPAISKHLKVLDKANLIHKRKDGRNNYISLNSQALQEADIYLERYRRLWQQRYRKLNQLLQEDSKDGKRQST